MKAVVLGPGKCESLNVAGNEIVCKLHAPATGGAIGLVDCTAAGFPGPPAHRHMHLGDTAALGEGPFDPARLMRLVDRYDIEFEE